MLIVHIIIFNNIIMYSFSPYFIFNFLHKPQMVLPSQSGAVWEDDNQWISTSNFHLFLKQVYHMDLEDMEYHTQLVSELIWVHDELTLYV